MLAEYRLVLILVSILALSSRADIIEKDLAETPLTFVEATNMIRQKAEIAKYLRDYNQIESDPFEINQFIRENFIQLADSHKTYSASPFGAGLPNVTQSCMLQLLQFVAALKTSEPWATQVVDAFGKPTSGIFLGSLTWIGEYQECINVTAPNDWNGKFCSLAKPVDPMNPPGPGSVVKLNMNSSIF
jgi:hypothetical protein